MGRQQRENMILLRWAGWASKWAGGPHFLAERTAHGPTGPVFPPRATRLLEMKEGDECAVISVGDGATYIQPLVIPHQNAEKTGGTTHLR